MLKSGNLPKNVPKIDFLGPDKDIINLIICFPNLLSNEYLILKSLLNLTLIIQIPSEKNCWNFSNRVTNIWIKVLYRDRVSKIFRRMVVVCLVVSLSFLLVLSYFFGDLVTWKNTIKWVKLQCRWSCLNLPLNTYQECHVFWNKPMGTHYLLVRQLSYFFYSGF